MKALVTGGAGFIGIADGKSRVESFRVQQAGKQCDVLRGATNIQTRADTKDPDPGVH